MMKMLRDDNGNITKFSAFEVATFIVEEFESWNMVEEDHWATAMEISDLAYAIMKADREKSMEPLKYCLGMIDEWEHDVDLTEVKKVVAEIEKEVCKK